MSLLGAEIVKFIKLQEFRRGSKAFACLIDDLRFLNCNTLVSLLQN